MAVALVKEDGSGKADANSYATVADGDAYHEGHLYAADWSAANPDKKAAALVMASRLIDALFVFRGLKSTEAQALKWPRQKLIDEDTGAELPSDRVPTALVHATAEAARTLIKADRTADPEGQGKSVVSDLATSSVTYNARDRRPVLNLVVQVMLAGFGRYCEAQRETSSAAVPLIRV